MYDDASKKSRFFEVDFAVWSDGKSYKFQALNAMLKDKYPNFEVGLKCIIMVI